MSTVYVDPACSTCRGSGLVTVDWGDAACPACRLRSRHLAYCDSCGEQRPTEGMVYAKGELTRTQYATCATCAAEQKAAHEASVEAAYRDAYGPDFDKLATYNVEGR